MNYNHSTIYPDVSSRTASNMQAYYSHTPRENISNLSEYNRIGRHNGTCGLENLGNTCFISSSLQVNRFYIITIFRLTFL